MGPGRSSPAIAVHPGLAYLGTAAQTGRCAVRRMHALPQGARSVLGRGSALVKINLRSVGVRTGWPVGRVLYAEAWRPSIYDDRCRPPPAIYPRTRAGSPRTCAHPGPEGLELLDLAPGGVCLADRVTPVAGGLLHRRFILTAPRRSEGRRSFFCGTVPQVAPGGCYPPPCPVEPGPSSAPCSLSVAR